LRVYLLLQEEEALLRRHPIGRSGGVRVHVLPRRVTFLIGSAALLAAGVAALGWVFVSSDGTRVASPAASDVNTASQKTFENSASLVDVTDEPISFPSENVIYPPSTGSAGMSTAQSGREAALALSVVALALVALARILTAGQSRGANT
jgi:hypothetical protein